MTKLTSYSDNGSYPSFCEEASINDDVFSTFRSNQIYRSIVETCGPKLGLNYQYLIERQDSWLFKHLNKFITSEEIGGPKIYDYTIDSVSYSISPTTLRYISVLGDFIRFFGPLNNLRIVEIGVGYGGQCKLIHDLFKPRSYNLIDLAPALSLSKRFLSNFDIHNVNYLNLSDVQEKTLDCDLVISNYAFTEVERSLQNVYWDNIISKAKMGYMMCNCATHTWSKAQFSETEMAEKLGKVNIHRTAPPLTQSDAHANVSLLWWVT